MASSESTLVFATAIHRSPQADGVDVKFEGRWNAWGTRGLAHDRVIRRRLREFLPAIAIAGVIVYLFILMW